MRDFTISRWVTRALMLLGIVFIGAFIHTAWVKEVYWAAVFQAMCIGLLVLNQWFFEHTVRPLERRRGTGYEWKEEDNAD